MKHSEQIIVKRWVPILKEYERTKSKLTPRPFKFIKNLCRNSRNSRQEFQRQYT